MQLGERLAMFRRRYKYKQKDIAEKLNITQQVVSNIERSLTTPDINFLKGIADIYNISLDELIGRQGVFGSDGEVERQIIDILQKMDDKEKELSLRLVNQVAQYKGTRNE